jgi:glycosyltransferase involved in cell wall biosynthesis
MASDSLVSICIPAWERTRFLLEAVHSCLTQSYRNIEVIVTDDSRSGAVARALEPLLHDARVRYLRNEDRLGQAGNVNRLFELARGERLILLHDDDVLFPDAVEVLDRCWRENAHLIACYGKQYVISHSGNPLPRATQEFDRTYHRTEQRAGLPQSKLWAALVEQMPPDGAMIHTEAARRLRFRGRDVVGDDCDYDFIARLAQQPGGFFFVDRYLSKYRLTDKGVASEKTVDYTFTIARDLQLPPELEDVRRDVLRSRASYAVRCRLAAGQRESAWRLIRNPDYWSAPRSRARVVSAVLALLPGVVLRSVNAMRRFVGTTLRRSDGLYRLLGRLRSVR